MGALLLRCDASLRVANHERAEADIGGARGSVGTHRTCATCEPLRRRGAVCGALDGERQSDFRVINDYELQPVRGHPMPSIPDRVNERREAALIDPC